MAQSLTTLIDVKFELEEPFTDLRQAPDPPTVRAQPRLCTATHSFTAPCRWCHQNPFCCCLNIAGEHDAKMPAIHALRWPCSLLEPETKNAAVTSKTTSTLI